MRFMSSLLAASAVILIIGATGAKDIAGYRQYSFGTPIKDVFEHPNHYWSLDQSLGISRYAVSETFDLSRYKYSGTLYICSLAKRAGQGTIDAVILPIYKDQMYDERRTHDVDMYETARELYDVFKSSYSDELIVTDETATGRIKLVLSDESGDMLSLIYNGTWIDMRFESWQYRDELLDPNHRNR